MTRLITPLGTSSAQSARFCSAVLIAAASVFIIAGCSSDRSSEPNATVGTFVVSPNASVQSENQLFLNQKSFDPWVLSSGDPHHTMEAYLAEGNSGSLYDAQGDVSRKYAPGDYKEGVLASTSPLLNQSQSRYGGGYAQNLDLLHGTFTTNSRAPLDSTWSDRDWSNFWAKSDIVVAGDPEAQQVIHANMFYLAGSAMAGGSNSIPPMGYSSNIYQGHIFWDAETWMLPALIVQHPDLARGIIDYRFKHLRQAKKLAAMHGFNGAEYPWESAGTGMEEAPGEFARERHITADIALAAWQYYLWTGDRKYLSTEGWPIIQANAQYWTSRAKLGKDGKYHILQVIGPDESAGPVDDDAWTNAIVAKTLDIAYRAAEELAEPADPRWPIIATKMTLLTQPGSGIYQENAQATDHLMAKQADTQMLIYPLDMPIPANKATDTLNYYIAHTIDVGPAMTSSINSIIASRLGLAQQSLDLFHESYRPFMRGPWDAFSEKRTKDNVYFCTGMGGCLQSVLYGFAGLAIVESGKPGKGTLVAKSADVALYANPHLPPGWTGLTIKGVDFRGNTYNLAIAAENKVTLMKK